MNTNLKPSKTCLDIITKFEGFNPEPYICPAGYWTAGIGTRIKSKQDFLKKHPNGLTFTEAQNLLLAHIVNTIIPLIVLYIKVELTQDQFDAIVSLIYNIGEEAFLKSTLLKHLNLGEMDLAAKEFIKWNKATVNGRLIPLPGLTRRRTAEELLFESKEWKTI